MFDVGFAELFLLAIVGLVVLGPQRLPQVARTVGALIRRARSSWNSLQRSLEAELKAEELKRPLEDAKRDLDAAAAGRQNDDQPRPPSTP